MALKERENSSYRFVLDIVATERPALQNGPERVQQLVSRHLPEGMAIGLRIEGLVRLHSPSEPIRPSAYDFAFHNYYRGIGMQGYFMGKTVLAAVVPAPDSFVVRLQIRIAGLHSFMTYRIMGRHSGRGGRLFRGACYRAARWNIRANQ